METQTHYVFLSGFIGAFCLLGLLSAATGLSEHPALAYETRRSCEDTDGFDPNTKGRVDWVFGDNSGSEEDFCLPDGQLYEFGCGIDNIMGETPITCDGLCVDGRCTKLVKPAEPVISGLLQRYSGGEEMSIVMQMLAEDGTPLEVHDGWRMQFNISKWGRAGMEEETATADATYRSDGNWKILLNAPKNPFQYFLNVVIFCWEENGCQTENYTFSRTYEFTVGDVGNKQVDPLPFVYRNTTEADPEVKDYYKPNEPIVLDVSTKLSDESMATESRGWVFSYAVHSLMNGVPNGARGEIEGGPDWDVIISTPATPGTYQLDLTLSCILERGCLSKVTSKTESHEFEVSKKMTPKIEWEKSYNGVVNPGEDVHRAVLGTTEEYGVVKKEYGWKVQYRVVEVSGKQLVETGIAGDAERRPGQKTWSIRFTAPTKGGKYVLIAELLCKPEFQCFEALALVGTEYHFTVPGIPSGSAEEIDGEQDSAGVEQDDTEVEGEDEGEDSGTVYIPPAEFEEEVNITNPFSDVDPLTDAGEAAISLFHRAIIGGYPDGEFKGWKLVNRSEAAKFLLNGLGVDIGDLPNAGRFSDVTEGEWYVRYIMKAAELGIITGDAGKSTYRPADGVNTAEFLAMLARTFKIELHLPHSYTDVLPSDWFDSYAGIAKRFDLFPGRSVTLKPGSLLTRKDVAIALFRFLEHEDD